MDRAYSQDIPWCESLIILLFGNRPLSLCAQGGGISDLYRHFLGGKQHLGLALLPDSEQKRAGDGHILGRWVCWGRAEGPSIQELHVL